MTKRARFRKYVCADCGKGTMLPLRAFDRRTRPRCAVCGSLRLDPGVSAAETLAVGHEAHQAAEGRAEGRAEATERVAGKENGDD